MKIVEQVRDLIKEGRLKSGDKLPPEQVLAEKFGTSRPSVREALSALEILGITESRGGKGNFIKDNLNLPLYEQKFREFEEEESPFELLEARKVLETGIVGLATKKGYRGRYSCYSIDKLAILKAAEETGIIITCEEHQVGGFGNIIAGVIAQNKKYSTPLLMDMIGVEDRFGESGEPW